METVLTPGKYLKLHNEVESKGTQHREKKESKQPQEVRQKETGRGDNKTERNWLYSTECREEGTLPSRML